MIFFYRLFFVPLFILSAPFYLRRKLRRDRQIGNWLQYLGCFPKLPKRDVRPQVKRIWIQAVSVGEILAIEPLIKQLCASANIEIVLTTTTSTGYKEARDRYANSTLGIGLFPIDFWSCSALAWSRIQPDAVILAESELWPEHLHQASNKGVPVFLINARLSDRSFARLKRFNLLAQFLINKIQSIYCATQIDHKRFSALGANPEPKIGNIKLDVDFGPPLSPSDKVAKLSTMGFKHNEASSDTPFILIGASTWPGEESLLIRAQKYCIDAGVPCQLILVPRHVERRNEITKLLNEQSLPWSSASGDSGNPSPSNTDSKSIFLSDTTGHLANLLKVADLAFIGKSMPQNTGGQTPIEAAAQGIPIIFGPNMSNFQNISDELIQLGAAQLIARESDFNDQVLTLARDTQATAKMKEAGIHWHQSHKGIIAYIGDDILKKIKTH